MTNVLFRAIVYKSKLFERECIKLVKKSKTIWNKQFTCAFLANFMLCFSQQSVNTLISTYADFLGAGAVIVGMVSGLYFAVAVAARPFSGPIITRQDKRLIMIFTYTLGVITGIMYAVSNSISLFIVARILHGIEFAFVGSLNLTVASDSLPKEKLGTGIGTFGLGGAIATAVGPGMGIAVRDWFMAAHGEAAGYVAVFILSAAFMFLGLIPAFLMNPSKPSKEVLASLGPWYKSIAAKEAIVPAVLMCLVCMAQNLVTVYMVPFAAWRNIENVAMFFTVYAIFLLISRPLCGKLVDVVGVNRVFIPSGIVYMLAFVLIGTAHALPQLLVAAALSAIGFGTLNPAMMTLCMRSVPIERRGVASNTQYFGMDIGYFAGPFLGGMVYAAFGYANMYLLALVPLVLACVVLVIGWHFMKNKLY